MGKIGKTYLEKSNYAVLKTKLISDKVTPVIVPEFWTGKLPIRTETYEIDCNNYDMKEDPINNPELVSKIETTFQEQGIVLLRNTRLNKLEDMHKWALIPMGGKQMKYEGGANNRAPLVENVYDVGAPKE